MLYIENSSNEFRRLWRRKRASLILRARRIRRLPCSETYLLLLRTISSMPRSEAVGFYFGVFLWRQIQILKKKKAPGSNVILRGA
jgi:hypothetical protein